MCEAKAKHDKSVCDLGLFVVYVCVFLNTVPSVLYSESVFSLAAQKVKRNLFRD